MQEKYYLKKWELFCITLNLTTCKAFTAYTKIFSDISGSGAFLGALFSGLIAFLILWGMLRLYEKSPRKTLIQIAKESLGEKAGYLVFGGLLLYLLFSLSFTLFQTGELIKEISFPSAPISFVFLIIALGGVICCAQGFDGIGRCHSLIIPLSLILVIAVIGMSFLKGDISNLSPLLGYGAKSTFIKGLSGIGIYADLIILFMLYPFSKEGVSFKKTVLSSFGVGAIINSLIVLGFTMIAPYNVAGAIKEPYLQMVKLFSMGRFFQRIDGYFMYVFSICTILSLGINMFFISYGAKEVFDDFPKTRPLAYPLGLLAIFLALILKESGYDFRENLWIWETLIFLIVFIILIISKIKGRERA